MTAHIFSMPHIYHLLITRICCTSTFNNIFDMAETQQVVCEYPDRSRTKGNSHTGPISWMNEHPPDVDLNTAYKTRAEKEYDENMEYLANAQPPKTPSPTKTTPGRGGGVNASGAATTLGDKNRSVAQLANLRPATAFSAPPPTLCSNGQSAPTFEKEQRPPSSFGPVKEVGNSKFDGCIHRH